MPNPPADQPDFHSLAERFGTPLWVYDASIITRRIEEVQRFDTVRYAQKANSNLAVLALMRRHGVKVDAVTAGELHRAQAAGYELGSDDVIYTADLFDDDALDWIARHRIPVNVGSPDMIDQLAAPGSGRAGIDVPITLRINPGFGHGHSRKVNTGGESSKHGIWHTQVADCLAAAARHGLTVRGLHMHIGSGADFDHLSRVAGAMVDAARTFVQHADSLRVISAGGGLPIPYRPEQPGRIDLDRYYAVWDDARRTIAGLVGHDIHLEVEPGRYLVAESGYLIARVRSVKHTGDHHYTLVDAGFNDLIRPSFYGAFHHITVHPPGSAPGVGASARMESADPVPTLVAGPLCESCDVFTQDEDGTVTPRDLPPAAVGDLLVLHDAGAYGAAMSSNYNSRRLAAEVMLIDDEPHVVRRRQPLEDLTALETIPA